MPAPDRNKLEALHASLLRREPTASEALVRECLTPLVRTLRIRNAAVPRDLLADAACDALLSLIGQPERFDASRASLFTFLTMVAERRLIDRLRSLQRIRRVEIGGIDGSNLSEFAASECRDLRADDPVSQGELPAELEAWLKGCLPDNRDRILLKMICQGRQSASDFADVLGITGLPISEQRTIVKQQRDRILNRLRRRRADLSRIWSSING